MTEHEVLQEMSKKNLMRSLLETSATWLVILVALTMVSLTDNIILKAILFVIIATRQYALLILMHDGLHGSLCENRKINDLISQYLLAYPLGGLFFIGRDMHLQHHRLVGTESDPDLGFYSPHNKSTHHTFLSYFFINLLFMQIKYSLFNHSTNLDVKLLRPKTNRQAFLIMASLQLLILILFWWFTRYWYYYIIFWFLPIITLTVFFDKVRIFCEHTPFQDDSHGATAVLRTFRSTIIEKFFLAPFDMNYHAEHHLYPGVPHQNLNKLHNILMSGNINKSNQKLKVYYTGTYMSFLWNYFKNLRKKYEPKIEY